MKTSVIRLDYSGNARSATIIDFQEEDTQFSLAETALGLASTKSPEGLITVYSGAGSQTLERTAGFPKRLLEAGPRFVSLDKDGNIAWYDSGSGELLAIFRLHPAGWSLQTKEEIIEGIF
jgi:hypothetical protein